MIAIALIKAFEVASAVQQAIAAQIVGLEPFKDEWPSVGQIAGANSEALGQFEQSLKHWNEVKKEKAVLRTALKQINKRNNDDDSIYHR